MHENERKSMNCFFLFNKTDFDDYSLFVKFFKKMSGLSPAEFRKQVKE
jgi:YesN/AraC family two-component response regulator